MDTCRVREHILKIYITQIGLGDVILALIVLVFWIAESVTKLYNPKNVIVVHICTIV